MSAVQYAAKITDIQRRIATRRNAHRSAGELYERAAALTTQHLKDGLERVARNGKWTPWSNKTWRARA